MKRMLRSFGWLSTLCMVFMTSCATVRLTSVWNDEANKRHPKNILVIAAVSDPEEKRLLEQEFVRQLKARGVDAVAGFSVFAGGMLLGKGTLAEKIEDQGADAILISSVKELQAVTIHIPEASYAPLSYYGTWYDYYSAAHIRPGYAIQGAYAALETNLYDARTDRLIWTAASQTYANSFGQKWKESYVATIIKKLASQNVFKAALAKVQN